MHFNVLSLFPDLMAPYLGGSILGKAQESGRLSIHLTDIRNFTTDKHKTADDTPYGGGEGMVLKPEPLKAALDSLEKKLPVILLSPGGPVFSQAIAEDISRSNGLTLICGRYEGVDQRLIEKHVDQELSIGPYILAGGELGAMVVIESVARLIPGVLGNPSSVTTESITSGSLKYPQFTKPREWENILVPDVLLSGNHAEIQAWRAKESILRNERPTEWKKVGLPDE